MSIKNKEFSTEKKLGFIPMESPALNKVLKSKAVENIDDKMKYLNSLGIHNEFALQLNDMFEQIKANTDEIMGHAPEIVAANNRTINQSELSYKTKTNLAIMKHSA